MDSPGFARIREDSLGLAVIRGDSLEFARIPSDSLGFTGIRNDSGGFAGIRRRGALDVVPLSSRRLRPISEIDSKQIRMDVGTTWQISSELT